VSRIAKAIEGALGGVNTIGGSKMAEPTGLMDTVGGRLVSPEEAGVQPQPEVTMLVGTVDSHHIAHPNGDKAEWDGTTWPPTPADADRQTVESWIKSWSPRLHEKATAKADEKTKDNAKNAGLVIW
jgi:hypothetical protein